MIGPMTIGPMTMEGRVAPIRDSSKTIPIMRRIKSSRHLREAA